MIESPRVKTTRYIVVYAILTLGAIVMLVPLLWTVSHLAENARQSHHSSFGIDPGSDHLRELSQSF